MLIFKDNFLVMRFAGQSGKSYNFIVEKGHGGRPWEVMPQKPSFQKYIY
jgi:hypothetical protein